MSPVRPSSIVVSPPGPSTLTREISDAQPNRVFLGLVVMFSNQWEQSCWTREWDLVHLFCCNDSRPSSRCWSISTLFFG